MEKMNKPSVLIEAQATDLESHDGSIEDHGLFSPTNHGPDFRGVSMIGAAVLIAKSQIGLGVLGLPSTLDSLGFLPGLLSLIGLCIISTWTGIVVGKFRLAHPQIYSVDDAAAMLFGKCAKEFMGIGFWLFYTLCYGAALITVSIALNTFSGHSMCTSGWLGIAAIISLIIGTSVRTMKVLSWLGYVSLGSIFIAIWIVAIACLTQKVPAAAPDPQHVTKSIKLVSTDSSFSSIASAVASQLLSLCGTASFFNIHAEMKDPKQYSKSLYLGQGFVVFNYIVVSSIVYGKVGQYVASPALGSAGPLFQKVGYGIAFPGLLFSAFFQAHLAGKYAFVRILRNTVHLQQNSKTHWVTWIFMMIIVIIIGFIVACAIPFFGDLIALIGALLGTSFTLILPAFLALYEISGSSYTYETNSYKWFKMLMVNWKSTRKTKFITGLSIFIILLGFYILVSGLYGSIKSISEGYSNGTIDKAFSCGDNSGL